MYPSFGNDLQSGPAPVELIERSEFWLTILRENKRAIYYKSNLAVPDCIFARGRRLSLTGFDQQTGECAIGDRHERLTLDEIQAVMIRCDGAPNMPKWKGVLGPNPEATLRNAQLYGEILSREGRRPAPIFTLGTVRFDVWRPVASDDNMLVLQSDSNLHLFVPWSEIGSMSA